MPHESNSRAHERDPDGGTPRPVITQPKPQGVAGKCPFKAALEAGDNDHATKILHDVAILLESTSQTSLEAGLNRAPTFYVSAKQSKNGSKPYRPDQMTTAFKVLDDLHGVFRNLGTQLGNCIDTSGLQPKTTRALKNLKVAFDNVRVAVARTVDLDSPDPQMRIPYYRRLPSDEISQLSDALESAVAALEKTELVYSRAQLPLKGPDGRIWVSNKNKLGLRLVSFGYSAKGQVEQNFHLDNSLIRDFLTENSTAYHAAKKALAIEIPPQISGPIFSTTANAMMRILSTHRQKLEAEARSGGNHDLEKLILAKAKNYALPKIPGAAKLQR